MASRLNTSAARLSFCAALLLSAVMASAQGSQSGGITGTVKDQSGAMVGGAVIEIYNLETGVLERHVTTNAEGLYTIVQLRPGSYRVEVTDAGFSKFVTTLVVRLNETARLDVTLKVGAFSRNSQFRPPEPWLTRRARQPASLSIIKP